MGAGGRCETAVIVMYGWPGGCRWETAVIAMYGWPGGCRRKM